MTRRILNIKFGIGSSVVVYREVKLKDLPDILRQTVITNAVAMLLIGKIIRE